MKNHRHSMIPGAAGLILLLSGATATVLAQAPSPSPDKMPHHQAGMKEMKGMSGMESQPHHVLAMAYRANLETFARALLASSTKSKAVDVDLARPAVAEMRRSFDQMRQHHQAQMTTMGDKTKPPMSGTMQDMQSHLAALDEHLTALESAVNVGTPDAKVVSAHTTEILKQCDKMSAKTAKTAKTAPHHIK